ncbi:restriction endonuclease [Escherichia sp. SP-MK2]
MQCKNYNQTKIAKKDIDSFLASSVQLSVEATI